VQLNLRLAPDAVCPKLVTSIVVVLVISTPRVTVVSEWVDRPVTVHVDSLVLYHGLLYSNEIFPPSGIRVCVVADTSYVNDVEPGDWSTTVDRLTSQPVKALTVLYIRKSATKPMAASRSEHPSVDDTSCLWYRATPIFVPSVTYEIRVVILLIVRIPVPAVPKVLPVAVEDTNAYTCGYAKLYSVESTATVASK